jgi:hypothetical protein
MCDVTVVNDPAQVDDLLIMRSVFKGVFSIGGQQGTVFHDELIGMRNITL